MNVPNWFRGLISGLVAVTVAGIAAAPAAASPVPTGYSTIDTYVRSQMDDAHLPGLAYGLVRGDEVVHVNGFGRADPTGRLVTTKTPFVIGSVSKSFTALAIMQLAEAGKVDLEAPVKDYVGEFRLAGSQDANRITVRELLNQTSGIPTLAGIEPLTDSVTSLDAQVRRLATVNPASQPGSTFAYSNANYEVLGRLVEEVSGQKYGDYIQQHVFGPLGMSSSFTSVDPARAAGLAGGCEIWFGVPQCLMPGTGFRPDFVPAGFLMASVEDMSRYVVAQMNGGTYGNASVLSPSSVAAMHAPAVNAGISAQGGSYAMGWFVGPRAGVPHTIWHNGSAAANHSMVLMLPDSGWGVVLLANAESLLYTMLGRLDVIADGIASLLVNTPKPGTLAGLYPAFDVAVVLIVLLQLRSLVRIWRRGSGLPVGKGRIRTVVFELVIPVWRELVAPIAIFVGLPAALGAPWANLAKTDVGGFVLALAVLLLLTGMVRAYRLRALVANRISTRFNGRVSAGRGGGSGVGFQEVKS